MSSVTAMGQNHSRSYSKHYKICERRRGPRNVRLIRSENGFGFTLRHFIVYPPESYQVLASDKRLGLRMSEGRGDEPMETIFVKSVRPGSPAAVAGLVTGDRILGVNGEPTVHRPYTYVVSLIQASRDTLNLLVVSKQEDIIQLYFGDTAHNPETNVRPSRLRSPEMHRSPSSKHPALTTPRRSLDTMPQHHSRPPLTASSALDYQRPHLSPSPALDRPLLSPSPALERPMLIASPALDRTHMVPSPSALERPPLASSPALERVSLSASLDYDPRLLDPGSPPLTTPGSRLSLDGGSPSRDSRESSVNSVHSSDDSVIISRIIKSCEQKKEFLRRPVVWAQPGGQPPYWSQSQPYCQPPERPGGQPTWGRLQAPVWPSAIPASSVPPAAPPSPGPFICGGPVSNPPFTQRQHDVQPPAIRFVSERARQFESGQCHPDKIMLYKSELARLGTTNSGANVAVRRREFENRASDWRSQRESRSLDSTTSISSHSGSQIGCAVTPSPVVPVIIHLSGNRTIPVGGTRPHCEPPPQSDYQPSSHAVDREREREIRPRSNSLGAAVQREDGSERRRNKAVRQDSYLAAVKKFVDLKRRRARLSAPVISLEKVVKRVPKIRLTASSPTRLQPDEAAVKTGKSSRPRRPKTLHLTSTYEPDRTEGRAGESADCSNIPHSSLGLDSVIRRSKPASLDSQDEDRATRRESYLKATGSDRNMDTDHELSDSEPSYKSVSNHLPPCDKEIVLEGNLTCKVTQVEGKKSQDRSWKSVWAVLRGTILLLFRDKKDSTSETPVDYERIDMEAVSVNVAEDYSKRRHVFKLSSTCSSEILLQADSSQDMMRWLQALHHDNNNIHSLSSIQSSTGAVSKNSNSSISKLTTFRNRSPTGQSPTSKSRKPSQSDGVGVSKPKTWKGRFTEGFKLKKNLSPVQYPEYPEGATIGVPLDLCPQSNTLEYVPLLVELCTHIVEDKGLDIIGIYRVPGNTAAVSSLTQAVNRGLDQALLDQDQRWTDVNVISSLLKSFFRKLPDCLLTTELYPQFIEADKIEDPCKRVAVLRRLVHELPVHNFTTLRHLMLHLKTVVNHSDINKMEARNLAIVFGPTLIKAADNNMATLVNDMSHQCRIVETLILYVDWCFSEDDLEKLVLKEDAVSAEIHESESTNQSLLLDNIHKVEGLKESPTKDMSAKDIVSSIISAANRKMQKARRGKSIVSIAEESPTDQTSTTSLCDTSIVVKTRDGKTGRGGGKGESSSHDVASRVRQSVIFSGSVTSKILSSNDSQSDKDCDVKVEEEPAPTSRVNSVEGGTIRSYTGLQQVTQERVRRFEMETKAMLQRENLRKRDEKETPNSSLTAIAQSIGSSKEAVDNLGKRLKTCKEGGKSSGGTSSVRKGSLDSLKDSSWGEWNAPSSTDEWSTNCPLASTRLYDSQCCSFESLLDLTRHRIFDSTDSLGGDLVVSLTSTFDAKMKDLSVVKTSAAATKEEASSDAARESAVVSPANKQLAEDFRDPSLHKSPTNNHTQCKLSSDTKSKEGEDKEKEVEVLSDKENCNTKLRRSESLNKREEKKESGKLRRTESLKSKTGSDKLKRSDSLTKNEKTESNLNKRRQLEAGKMYKMKRKTGGINERGIKRRHTVGGTKDFDKVTWLDNRQAEEEEKTRRTSSPDLSRHILMEVRPWSLIEPSQVLNRPLESHM